MINIEVDGRPVEANENETILTVLRRNGVHVPTLCHINDLPPSGACRMCIVEVEGAPTLTPSCSYPVTPGMKIKSRSPRVLAARRMIVELLLSNHPDDCLYCGRNQRCDLQTLAQDMGVRQRRFRGDKSKREMDVSSPSIIRDPEKCVLCGKCVRVCEEIQGVAAIDFVGRGSRAFIGCAFDTGLNVSSCINCGQCVVVCPTGALTEHSYLNEVVSAPVGQTRMHWPQLTQLETFRPVSNAHPMKAFEPRPTKSMADTPWTSSQIRTHLPHSTHFSGSRMIDGLETSISRLLLSPRNRRWRTPMSWASVCRSHRWLRPQ